MCADCHTTGYEKKFDVATKRYHTTYKEEHVGCEACHGPASEHVKWAANGKPGEGLSESEMGLAVSLRESKPVTWFLNPETGQPTRSHPTEHRTQVETCARCHAHRRLIENPFAPRPDLLDSHKPSLLEPRLYHYDGQIKEEVYVYGSFAQSRMYHAGVRCSDCHDPHTLKPRAQGNALCVPLSRHLAL